MTEYVPLDGDGAEKEKKPTQRDLLIECASDAALWHDPDSTGYATLVVDGVRQNHRLRSKTFRSWLCQRYFDKLEGAAGAQAVEDAQRVLEARAQFKGPEFTPHVRLAEHEGSIYIDLADSGWRAVEVTAQGWSIVTDPPVKFIRPRAVRALPVPVPGGSLDELRRLVNVASDSDYMLVAAWLVGALKPTGPYPVLVLNGEQGSAKSTTARAVRRLLDPNTADVRSSPRNEQDLLLAARNGWVVCLDNLSYVQTWLADGICRLSTGGGFGARELYSDLDEIVFEAQRPVILNGIPDLATRGDLADRAIVVTLPVISDKDRRTEREFWTAHEAAAGRIFGALLDALSMALRRHHEVRLQRRPRMADFAEWITAAEPALGWPEGAFMDAYDGNRASAIETTIEADAFATAVRELVEQDDWTGTATGLLAEVNAITPETVQRHKDWPKAPNKVSDRLRRAAPSLRAIGIHVWTGRRKGRSHIEVRKGAQTIATIDTTATLFNENKDLGGGDGWRSGGDTPGSAATPEDAPNGNETNTLVAVGGDGGDSGDRSQPFSSPSLTCTTCGEPVERAGDDGVPLADGTWRHHRCHRPELERKEA